MSDSNEPKELQVTFHPALYLQRRGWVLDIMRREGVQEVLDVGCGEGELLSCLCNPAPWLAPPPQGVLPAIPAQSSISESATAPEPDTTSDLESNDLDAYTAVLAELHRDILHPKKISGLDICKEDLDCTVRMTKPPLPEETDGTKSLPVWHRAPARWEELEVNVWEGGLEHVNPAFVGVDCIVATEVIEHLPEPILARFAPAILGAYRPRLLLLTTPSYTFNARFTAPDAPASARCGWRDPTGRTARVFRHHDHKFEWTVEEFGAWCAGVAEDWGYELAEVGGVGRAQETDEWGRDEALGWASQVAAFRRRDGEEWEARRARRWAEMEDLRRTTEEDGGTHRHQLLVTHQHPAHEASGRPQPLDVVGELVVEKMVRFRETAVALTEMWFEQEVERACGGWVDWLVRAIQTHDGLTLRKTPLGSGSTPEWAVHLEPAFHHLILPKPHVDAWATPPDTDEVEDPGDPFDDDDYPSWTERDGGALARSAGVAVDEETVGGEWAAADVAARQDVGWGAPDSGGWGKVADFDEAGSRGWGAPEGEWTWGEQ